MKNNEYIYIVLIKALTGLGKFARLTSKYDYEKIKASKSILDKYENKILLSYFSMLYKNVEGYSGVASEIDDEEYLTDSELFSQLSTILRERYQSASLRELSKAQKLDLARTLHYELRSSNSQIRRVLGVSQYEVDSLFPMSAKK